MEREDKEFTLRAYYKSELAQLYCPGRSPSASLQTLYRWIQRNVQLKEELENVGYNKYRHCFLRKEVAVIVRFLGEP